MAWNNTNNFAFMKKSPSSEAKSLASRWRGRRRRKKKKKKKKKK
jgi:hypothetical protein